VSAKEAAAAAILDGDGRLLLVREGYDRRRYTFPGGAFAPDEIPEPSSNLLHHSLEDVVQNRRGVVRDRLPRIN
jgi:hypothetical protein